MTQDLWVIVGASSSVGRAFALEAARSGADLVLAGRDLVDIEASAADLRLRTARTVTVLHFDAVAFDDHDAFVARCWELAAERRLSIFYAAGTMPNQEAALADFTLARLIIDVNFTSVVSIMTRFEPGLLRQHSGAVVVLGSVAGDRGRRKNFVYGSAKAGLHAFLGGMRSRLSGEGVSVVTVKPGFLDTAMTWGLPGLFLVASPAAAAKASLKAVRKGRDVIYFPRFWRLIMMIIRAVPEPIFKKLSI